MPPSRDDADEGLHEAVAELRKLPWPEAAAEVPRAVADHTGVARPPAPHRPADPSPSGAPPDEEVAAFLHRLLEG